MLNASKLTSVAIAKEGGVLTPLGNKFGKPGSLLKNKDVSSISAAATTNDRIQNYLNTLQPNGTSSIIDGGPLRCDSQSARHTKTHTHTQTHTRTHTHPHPHNRTRTHTHAHTNTHTRTNYQY